MATISTWNNGGSTQYFFMCVQDSYEELVMTVGSRRSGLNQNMALKEQYERALQDLTDLVDTAKDKMAADQRIIASSVEEVQNHLDKHKVGSAGGSVERLSAKLWTSAESKITLLSRVCVFPRSSSRV